MLFYHLLALVLVIAACGSEKSKSKDTSTDSSEAPLDTVDSEAPLELPEPTLSSEPAGFIQGFAPPLSAIGETPELTESPYCREKPLGTLVRIVPSHKPTNGGPYYYAVCIGVSDAARISAIGFGSAFAWNKFNEVPVGADDPRRLQPYVPMFAAFFRDRGPTDDAAEPLFVTLRYDLELKDDVFVTVFKGKDSQSCSIRAGDAKACGDVTFRIGGADGANAVLVQLPGRKDEVKVTFFQLP